MGLKLQTFSPANLSMSTVSYEYCLQFDYVSYYPTFSQTDNVLEVTFKHLYPSYVDCYKFSFILTLLLLWNKLPYDIISNKALLQDKSL